MIFKRLKLGLCHLSKARDFVQVRFLGDLQKKIKQSYYHLPGDFILSCSTLGNLVDEAADKCGDRTAFISPEQGISRTYSEFKKEVDKFASGLLSLGLNKGDKIAICAPNTYEWPVTQFATAKAGLVMVNINPAHQQEELEFCLNKVHCKALVVCNSFKTQDFYQMLTQIEPNLESGNPNHIQCSRLPDLKNIIMISSEHKKGIITFNETMEAGNAESNAILGDIEKNIQFDDPVNIQFTSGTTGKPKGAMLTHHNIVNNALVSGRRLGFSLLKPTICCQVPLFHCFGCVLATLGTVLFQATCVFPSAVHSAAANLKAIGEQRCTSIFGTPTMFVDLLNSYKPDEHNVKSLRQIVIGGAPAAENLVKDLKNTLQVPYINIAYGTTENSPGVAVSGINEDFSCSLKGLVQPLEFVELKVVNNKNQIVPINNEGELCTRGHVNFLGYYEDKEKTEEVVEETKWYHTGDTAVMNEYGYIRIVGRIKDMIIRGGENIYPQEIENWLHTHPSISEAHVVGVPDERMGEEMCAWILLKSGCKLEADDIKKHFKGKISSFKIPRYIMFVDTFPKTVSGKIQKFEMRKLSKEKLNL